jgi:monoamine oxidase
MTQLLSGNTNTSGDGRAAQAREAINRVPTTIDTNIQVMGERGKSTAIVIGGGFGGLATAIRLQAAGHAVTLVEAREPTSLRKMASPSIWGLA